MGIRRNLAADLGGEQSNGASAGGKQDEADTAGWAGWQTAPTGRPRRSGSLRRCGTQAMLAPDVRQHALTPFITLAAEPWRILPVFSDLEVVRVPGIGRLERLRQLEPREPRKATLIMRGILPSHPSDIQEPQKLIALSRLVAMEELRQAVLWAAT